MRKPWSRQILHKHLLNLLERPSTTLHLGAKRNGIAADVEFDDHFPPSYIRIVVDANNTPVAHYVIHELLHVILSELVLGKFDDSLEEVLIVALDTHIWAYVQRSKTRLAKWTSLIERKLAITDRPSCPVEELVDRSQEG